MTDTPALAELLKRVEQGDGADRELDAAIARAFNKAHGTAETVHIESRSIDVWDEVAAHYTSSLDAVLGLCERVLPGWDRQFFERNGLWTARLRGPRHLTISSAYNETEEQRQKYGQKHPARALLAAVLRALIDKEDQSRE